MIYLISIVLLIEIFIALNRSRHSFFVFLLFSGYHVYIMESEIIFDSVSGEIYEYIVLYNERDVEIYIYT